MNRNKLKAYAPQARRDFIQAVTDRAAHFGLRSNKIEPMTEKGDVVLIAGNAFPKAVGEKRKKLEARIKQFGFDQTMEAMAYTWFNRLVAIRFMELHEYLEHGYRVLSHPQGHAQPEILEHAQHVDLPGLNPQKVIELKLDGTKAEELYRMLLVAQCNALHRALPFLFEAIDDETELLLPDHLLHSDSLIRKLVNDIEDDDWQQVEIIGWLYQFYISEKKDEVIGKVVASEDIPAATQLFTPNWIVKYLVQNTLGRQWLATYPQSSLRQQMEYYIEPAEQTPEVQEQLKAITPTSLNPEELTLLDPACGSGHILVEAYDLFKAIYQERGYRAKDIPALILQKNLFGLEIDDRAAQLAAFALMMKARADDRRIFESDVKPNVLAFVESKGMNAADITHALNSPILQEPSLPKEMLFEEIEEDQAGLFSKKSMGVKGLISQADVAALLELFEDSKTFGSLIQIPPYLAAKLPEIQQRLADVLKHGDLMQLSARIIQPVLRAAILLSRPYQAVVANPPYMASKYMSPKFRTMAQARFPGSRQDLFSMFIERCLDFAADFAPAGFVTPYVWMFISSYEQLRRHLSSSCTITSLIQLEYNGFEPACVPVATFTLAKSALDDYEGVFIKLSDFKGHQYQSPRALQAIEDPNCLWRFRSSWKKIGLLPGRPIAYWMSSGLRTAFSRIASLGRQVKAMTGMRTGDNERFLRFWWEINFADFGLKYSKSQAKSSGLKWFPYNKGGGFRKWYGNHELVANWQNDGDEIKELTRKNYPELGDNLSWKITNEEFYFRDGITWSGLTSSIVSFRWSDVGALFDSNKGAMLFAAEETALILLGFLNSKIAASCLQMINPTLSTQNRDIDSLPFDAVTVAEISSTVRQLVAECVSLARNDYNSSEMAWTYKVDPLVERRSDYHVTCDSFANWQQSCNAAITQAVLNEERINSRFIAAYGLQDDLTPEVPDDQITLYRADREEDIKRLISYAVGCMMGRYSLDKPGLIYAHTGNEGFDSSNYKTFPADEDGIIPLTEFDWFADDVANRLEKFLATAWPAEHLDENLQFVAESLGPKKGGSPREAIRRYLAADFFKHHLSMYKKRPIYWLFSSGKQRGFQALVYLHRYNEGTLARMRTEYVIPLLGKMTARITHLTDDIAVASSSQHRKRLETEKATVTKQLAEVQAFDEKLRHYADQRITLDLDDGVKVNYGKFNDLLAEVKTIIGGEVE